MTNIHFNNHIDSKQSLEDVAKIVLNHIMGKAVSEPFFQLSVDDGDGDIWMYRITVDCERVKGVSQPITEN